MSLETVLDKLESKIEELLKAHGAAQDHAAEFEARIEDLEGAASGADEASARVEELESQALESSARITELELQRTELGERLEKVLGVIDGVLESGEKAKS